MHIFQRGSAKVFPRRVVIAPEAEMAHSTLTDDSILPRRSLFRGIAFGKLRLADVEQWMDHLGTCSRAIKNSPLFVKRLSASDAAQKSE
jgi:hypothetical protein